MDCGAGIWFACLRCICRPRTKWKLIAPCAMRHAPWSMCKCRGEEVENYTGCGTGHRSGRARVHLWAAAVNYWTESGTLSTAPLDGNFVTRLRPSPLHSLSLPLSVHTHATGLATDEVTAWVTANPFLINEHLTFAHRLVRPPGRQRN